MLKIKKAVFPSPEQWAIVVHGTRNAYKSWEKSDSLYICIEPRVEDPTTNYYVNNDLIAMEFQLSDEQEALLNDNENYDWISWIESEEQFKLGKNDKQLLKNLINAQGGEPSHSKFLRQLPVILDIKAPLYFWKQLDKYQIGTVTNSESTMHTIMRDEFKATQFSFYHSARVSDDMHYNCQLNEIIGNTIEDLNRFRDIYLDLRALKNKHLKNETWSQADIKEFVELKTKVYYMVEYESDTAKFIETGNIDLEKEIDKMLNDVWYTVIEMLPESYMQTRTWSANYQVLRTIVRQREGHPLSDEWATFIDWIRENVPMAKEFIFNEWDDPGE